MTSITIGEADRGGTTAIRTSGDALPNHSEGCCPSWSRCRAQQGPSINSLAPRLEQFQSLAPKSSMKHWLFVTSDGHLSLEHTTYPRSSSRSGTPNSLTAHRLDSGWGNASRSHRLNQPLTSRLSCLPIFDGYGHNFLCRTKILAHCRLCPLSTGLIVRASDRKSKQFVWERL